MIAISMRDDHGTKLFSPCPSAWKETWYVVMPWMTILATLYPDEG